MKTMKRITQKTLGCLLMLLMLGAGTSGVYAIDAFDVNDALQSPTADGQPATLDIKIQRLSDLADLAISGQFNPNAPDAKTVQDTFAQALVDLAQQNNPSIAGPLRDLISKAETSPLLRKEQQDFVTTNMLPNLQTPAAVGVVASAPQALTTVTAPAAGITQVPAPVQETVAPIVEATQTPPADVATPAVATAITAETPEQIINHIMSYPSVNEKLKGLYSLIQQAQGKEFDDATNVAFATALVNAFNEATVTQTYLGQLLPAATRTPLLNEQQQEYVKDNMLASPGLSPQVTQAAAATGLVPQEQVPTVAGELPMVPTEPVPAPTVPVKLPEVPEEKVRKKKAKKGKKDKKKKSPKKEAKKKAKKKAPKKDSKAKKDMAKKKSTKKGKAEDAKKTPAKKLAKDKATKKRTRTKKHKAKKAHQDGLPIADEAPMATDVPTTDIPTNVDIVPAEEAPVDSQQTVPVV